MNHNHHSDSVNRNLQQDTSVFIYSLFIYYYRYQSTIDVEFGRNQLAFMEIIVPFAIVANMQRSRSYKFNCSGKSFSFLKLKSSG